MQARRFDGFFPTQADFAYRMLTCLTKTVGTLSESDFLQLFDFPGRRKVLSRFRKAIFRGYVQMFMNPPCISRLKGLGFGRQRAYLRQAKAARCKGWRTSYDVYKGALAYRIDKETFAFWWNSLLASEQVIFLDACAHKIRESSYLLWLDGTGEDARICVRMAAGGESGAYVEF